MIYEDCLDCEWCGDDHHACDNCGHPATARRCLECGFYVCEIEAMHDGDSREARGLSRAPLPFELERLDDVETDCAWIVVTTPVTRARSRVTRYDMYEHGPHALHAAARRAVAWSQNVTGLTWPG